MSGSSETLCPLISKALAWKGWPGADGSADSPGSRARQTFFQSPAASFTMRLYKEIAGIFFFLKKNVF